jgi:hypothetical protein
MTATKILSEVLFSILRNWRQAIQIFLIPTGLVISLFIGIVFFGTQTVVLAGQTVDVPSPIVFVFLPVFLFLFFWPVVAWHRLLVLDDRLNGFLPPFRPSRVLRYVLNLFGLGLLLALIMMPIMAIITPIMMRGINPEVIIRGGMPPLSFFILPALASLPALYIGIRLSLILPGAAVGNHVGLSGSWDATSGKNSALIFIVILGAAISLISQILSTAMTPVILGAGQTTLVALQFIQLAAQTLSSLFVLSLISTMFLAFVVNKETG